MTDRTPIASYHSELNTLGYAPETAFTKTRTIINFYSFIKKDFSQITEAEIQQYVDHLLDRSLHSNTIRHYYADLEQFSAYLQRTGIIDTDPFPFHELRIADQEKNTREIITQEGVRQLYAAARKGRETILLHLCYGCGLRALELQRIDMADVSLSAQLLIVQKGKNSKRRVLPLPTSMLTDFEQHIAQRRMIAAPTDALLLNDRDRRLKSYTARTLLARIIARTDVDPRISLHSLRHSIATHLLENGMAAHQVQYFLGHEQLETTEIYTRVGTDQLKGMGGSKGDRWRKEREGQSRSREWKRGPIRKEK